MGYAQRMELEEELKMTKWAENIPLMTIEGQPITPNIKRKKDQLITQASMQCSAWQCSTASGL